MILHNQKFDTLAKAPIKQTDVVVAKQTSDAYGYFDGTVVWSSSDSLMSVNIDSVGSFLGTATKKAVVKLLGIVSTATSGDLFQVRLGIYDADPIVEAFNYISEGFFVVDNVEYDYEAGSTTVTMYDQMWAANNLPYIETATRLGFTFPMTVQDYAARLASAIGVDIMFDFATLPNADFQILADPYITMSNVTLRTVIGEIAGATGTTARISDMILIFSQYSLSDENLDSNNLKTLTIGKQYGPVTSVIFGRVPQNDNIVIANTGPSAYSISAVDTSTNLLTVVGNAMPNGDLVRIESTGDYPAPLLPDTNYYIYNYGDPDTFVLTTVPYIEPTLTNLIVNGSFNSGISTGWTTTDTDYITADSGNNGSPDDPINSIKFVSTTSSIKILSPIIDVSSTGTYTIIGYLDIKEITAGEVGFYIDEYDADDVWISGQWRTARYSVSAGDLATTYTPSSANVAKASLQIYASDDVGITAYLDNVRWYLSTFPDPEDIVDITSTGSGDISLEQLHVEEVQINNNQIVDDNRQTLLTPVYNKLVGIEWHDVKTDTTGLGWHEVGDVIQFTQDTVSVKAFIQEVHLVLAGSVKENIISAIPETSAIDYQTAGGILSSIYNTEIKTDKQGQDITSIVSRQDTYESSVTDTFAQVYQDIDEVTTTFQSSGGSNLILNSVGYSTSEFNLTPRSTYDDFEAGDYIAADGTKAATAGRARISYLLPVTVGDTLTFNTWSDNYKLIVRTYNSSSVFVSSVGAVDNAGTYTIPTGVGKISISIYNPTDSEITYQQYMDMLVSGAIRPTVSVGGRSMLTNWQVLGDGIMDSSTSPESQNKGALSGNSIDLSLGASITQRIIVQENSDTRYSLSFIAKKGIVGVATVSLTNTSDTHTVTIPDNTEVLWKKYEISGIRPTVGYLDLTVTVDATVVDFSITDIMVNAGANTIKWTQANGELLNTQVSLNSDGITVKSSVYDGDYTAITPLEFAGYSNASGTQQRVFSLNRDTTVVQKLESINQITMSPIKIVPVLSGPRAGWSFVKSGSN